LLGIQALNLIVAFFIVRNIPPDRVTSVKLLDI
jgi:hypothetical protein